MWEKVGDFLKGSLPVLGTALLGPAGGVAGSLLAKQLGVDNDPEMVLSKLQQDPDAISKYKIAELETNKEIVIAFEQACTERLRIVNQTMRIETNSFDAFVRRWRPFYGYCVALSWFVQMTGFTLVFVWVAIKNPKELASIVTQFAVLSGALVTLWGIALAVLGVSVRSRSKDKDGNKEPEKSLLQKFIGK